MLQAVNSERQRVLSLEGSLGPSGSQRIRARGEWERRGEVLGEQWGARDGAEREDGVAMAMLQGG